MEHGARGHLNKSVR